MMAVTSDTSSGAAAGQAALKERMDRDLVSDGEKLLFAMAHMNGHVLQSILRYQLQAVDFVRHRLHQDLKIAEAMADCCSFDALNEAGFEFYERMIEEYMGQAVRLSDIGAGVDGPGGHGSAAA